MLQFFNCGRERHPTLSRSARYCTMRLNKLTRLRALSRSWNQTSRHGKGPESRSDDVASVRTVNERKHQRLWVASGGNEGESWLGGRAGGTVLRHEPGGDVYG